MKTPEEIRKMEHEHVKMSYNKIEEYIYAGNNLCCQTHFEEELLSQGINTDISLELERVDNPKGVNYFFWFPWADNTAPSLELINLAIGVLETLIQQKIKSYIHCKNGHGRTTTFLAAYFISTKGLTADEELELVRQRRPSMHLNVMQKNFLKEFENSMS